MRELRVPDARADSPWPYADGNDHSMHNTDSMHSNIHTSFTLIARLVKGQVIFGNELALALSK